MGFNGSKIRLFSEITCFILLNSVDIFSVSIYATFREQVFLCVLQFHILNFLCLDDFRN